MDAVGEPPAAASPHRDGGDADAGDPRRWSALAVLAVVQFMLILDLTVVNVAIPTMQADLGIGVTALPWIVDGYALMAGGLLLLGGRLADMLGPRRIFMVGLVVFGLASLASGLAQGTGTLIAGRFAQGLGEALAAPAAMGLVAVLFRDPGERAKAIGMFAGLAGIGGTLGTALSGVLTSFASWRWIFLINVPVAVVMVVLVPRLVPARFGRPSVDDRRFDALGAVTVTASVVLLVLGLLRVSSQRWTSAGVLGPLVIGVVLLAVFVVVEHRSPAPLVPLRFLADRVRASAYIGSVLFATAFVSMFYLLTLYLQQVLAWTPLWAGLAYVPFGLAIGGGIGLVTNLVSRVGLRPLFAGGCILDAVGLLLLSTIAVDTGYATGLLPGMLVLGLGSGITLSCLGNAALHGVSSGNAGLSSGVQNASYQLGGALGLAVLSTIVLTQIDRVPAGTSFAEAQTSAYALAFRVAAGVLVVCAILVVLLVRGGVTAAEDTPSAVGPARA